MKNKRLSQYSFNLIYSSVLFYSSIVSILLVFYFGPVFIQKFVLIEENLLNASLVEVSHIFSIVLFLSYLLLLIIFTAKGVKHEKR